jgi:HK97 family phage portal protein
MGVLSTIARETRSRASVRAIETRASLENPNISLSDPAAWATLFGVWQSASGVEVTPERAMGIPANFCAIDFIAGTVAALPLNTYRSTSDGREKAERDPLYWILHDEVNEDLLTSFAWRKQAMIQVLWRGRSCTFIERNADKRVMNLWPLDTNGIRVERKNGRRLYHYRDGSAREVEYRPDEIIDIPFMLASDGITAVDPISRFRDTFGLAIALERYASKFFQNGGVPPLAMQMPSGASGTAARRGSLNIEELIQVANEEGRLVLPMPEGHRLEQIGFKPEDGQLTVARKLQNIQIGSLYHLPPVFLQDLEHGTFTNTEQQDLILVKHTLMQWLKCWEQELNAKLFSARSKNSVEFNIDGLLRGDFATRMAGYATAIQNAILEPDEVRELENRRRKGGAASELLIQGATVPLGQQLAVAGLGAQQKRNLAAFVGRMAAAALADDTAALNTGFVEATTEMRAGNPAGQFMGRVLIDLYPGGKGLSQ